MAYRMLATLFNNMLREFFTQFTKKLNSRKLQQYFSIYLYCNLVFHHAVNLLAFLKFGSNSMDALLSKVYKFTVLIAWQFYLILLKTVKP